MLTERTGVNKHAIELEKDKQSSYRSIYSLGPIELKTPKTYVETNLANSFIQLSKSPPGALIFFVQKLNSNLRLCVNYWGLNNLTINNRCLLPPIGKSLDWLKQAKQFT